MKHMAAANCRFKILAMTSTHLAKSSHLKTWLFSAVHTFILLCHVQIVAAGWQGFGHLWAGGRHHFEESAENKVLPTTRAAFQDSLSLWLIKIAYPKTRIDS